MKIVASTLCLMVGMCITTALMAQFPSRPSGGGAGGQTLPGGIQGGNRSYDPLAGSFPGMEVDTTGVDSSLISNIKPDTKSWDREALFLHRPVYKRPVGVDIARHHLWDEVEWAGGFVRSLGQVGKPYDLYLLGVNERYLDLPLWQNPIFGRYNRYVIDAEHQTQYYDTHTPYVNINFMQGDRRLLMTDVVASINIRPHINVSTYYERRRVEGAYAGMSGEHTLMQLTGNYHSRNERYFAFGGWVFNELSDGINGGILRNKAFLDFYPVVEGILHENNSVLNSEFNSNKNLNTNLRSDATRKILNRSMYLDHYFHLIGDHDSVVRPHKLTIRNSLLYGYNSYRFIDGAPNNRIDTSLLGNHLIPVYPTLDPDSLVLNEALISRQLKVLGGGSYTYDGLFRFNVHGDLNYQRISFRQDSTIGTTQHDITEQNIYGELDIKRLKAEASLRQRTSNLYAPARQLSLSGSLMPFPAANAYRFKDSVATDSSMSQRPKKEKPVKKPKGKQEEETPTFVPLSLSVQYDFRDIQPSLFQSHFQPRSGSTYTPVPGLKNQQLTQLVAGIRYELPAPVSRGDTMLPNYFYAKVHLYRHNQMIYYDQDFQLLQAADGEALTRIGAEVGFRMRFLRHFYWETRFNWQHGSASQGANPAFAFYADNLPSLYGKSSLYFDVRNIKIARKLRIGVDVYYNNSFNGMSIDPLSGEFFPVNYQVPGYLRADVYFAAKLLSAHLFIKYSHVNEGLFVASYYTTPFYPMLERTLSMGISWPFFD